MFKEQFKLAEITRFGRVSSTQNLCRETILNVKAAIGCLFMSTNSCTCSTRDLFAHITHISMCCSNKPLICVEATNGVCEYGPRSPTNFLLLGQLTLFKSVNSFNISKTFKGVSSTLENLRFMGAKVFEIAPPPPTPLVKGVCTKRLGKGRVNKV